MVTPSVRLVAQTGSLPEEIIDYLEEIGGRGWAYSRDLFRPESLVEFAGRLDYKSWAVGLNPNVTRVRSDQAAYIANILHSKHGVLLEHINFTFLLQNVSRVLTHELVRHRHASFSQESLRYVRISEIPVWVLAEFFSTDWGATNDEVLELRVLANQIIELAQTMQDTVGMILDRTEASFEEKKRWTSQARRFVPMGIATQILMTINARSLRHLIEVRTARGAEDEMRLVFDQIARIVGKQAPLLFGDFVKQDGAWVPVHSKV